jgi:hypothetical protein
MELKKHFANTSRKVSALEGKYAHMPDTKTHKDKIWQT